MRAEGEGVSAVVLAYHRKGELLLVLDKLQAIGIDEILIVENAPTDELGAFVSDRPAVRLLRPGENLGIGGRNLGAREARNDRLLMLDDDSYPLPGALEHLHATLDADPTIAVVGGLVRDVDSNGRVVKHHETGTFDWFLRAGREQEAPVEGFLSFFFPEGACLVRRDAFLEVGGFFEPFFFGSVEVELTTRLVANGWEVAYQPRAEFDHMKALGLRHDGRALRYRVRNHLWYLCLYFPRGMASRRAVGYLAFDLIEALWRRQLGAWLGGIVDAVRGWPAVRSHRSVLPRDVLRRAEMNRARLHVQLLMLQLRRRLPLVGRD
jgi:GT2 family glycosyltransferase